MHGGPTEQTARQKGCFSSYGTITMTATVEAFILDRTLFSTIQTWKPKQGGGNLGAASIPKIGSGQLFAHNSFAGWDKILAEVSTSDRNFYVGLQRYGDDVVELTTREKE